MASNDGGEVCPPCGQTQGGCIHAGTGGGRQKRLFAEGKACHDRCACGKAVGDVWHKLGACELTEDHRKLHCPDWLIKAGKISTWDPLFSRGVPARPKPVAVLVERTWFLMADGHHERCITGRVYSDGSSHGPFWKAARGGWAVVVMDDEGGWKFTLYGTMGGPYVDIYMAELKSALETLRLAIPPPTIYTDNADVIRGIGNGKAWCTAARTRGAASWRIDGDMSRTWGRYEGQGSHDVDKCMNWTD